MMTQANHANLWRERNKEKLEDKARKAAATKLKKEQMIASLRRICEDYGITDLTTNGYVYEFHYNVMILLLTRSHRQR